MPIWHQLRAAANRWNEDDASMMAAAVAYYVALSFLPTMLLFASGLGLFLGWTDSGHEAHDYLIQMVHERTDASLADSIQRALEDIEQLAVYGGPLGAVSLFLASLAIFAQLDKAFDRIYRVTHPSHANIIYAALGILKHRLRAFAMLFGLGCAVIGIFCAGIGFTWFQNHATSALPGMAHVWTLAEATVEVMLNSCVFAAIYRFVPRISVRWRHAFAGGLLAALVWEFGRQVLGTCFIGQRYTSAYGLIGALTGIMLWGYCGIAVLLAGAEYTQVLAERAFKPVHSVAAASRFPWLRAFDIVFACCLLYLASFFVLRSARCETVPDLSGQNQPLRAVIFSRNPQLQDAALALYRPLIAMLPPDRSYPSGQTVQSLALDENLPL